MPETDHSPQLISLRYSLCLVFVIGTAIISLIAMIYFPMHYSNPTEMQISTHETCRTVFIATFSGSLGLIFGKQL